MYLDADFVALWFSVDLALLHLTALVAYVIRNPAHHKCICGRKLTCVNCMVSGNGTVDLLVASDMCLFLLILDCIGDGSADSTVSSSCDGMYISSNSLNEGHRTEP